jgi:CDP-diacylglycerol---glycerol-3-phosphate 3-phosphatidyltransferase
MIRKDEKTSVWTLPNRLSVIRILFIPVIILLMALQQEKLLFTSGILSLMPCLLFIIAGITDGLDGLIARRMSMTTRLGVYLDQIADKLLISSVLIALTYYHIVPLWVTLTFVAREFIINGLRSFYAMEGIAIYPSFSGKLKTTLQIVGISCLLFSSSLKQTGPMVVYLEQLGKVVIYAALFFSIYSAYNYIYAIFRSPATHSTDM